MMCSPIEQGAMANRSSRHKTVAPRKLKTEPSAPVPQSAAQSGKPAQAGDPMARSHLEKGISELQGLHKLLLSSEVDPDVLEDFRSALNRVRNAAWAAQQSIARRENEQDSTTVHSLLIGTRVRATYQLCQALADDLKRTDIDFQRGSLIELYEATKNLTKRLKCNIDNRSRAISGR
jgi:hypothetical protein